MNKFLVVIPTYNEAESIGSLLLELSRLDVDVLIVDDGSPDGTAKIAKSHGVNMLEREKKLGLGNAYRAGFAWGLARGYDYLIEMDADGSHQVSDLARLIGTSANFDLTIGSRWVEGGDIENWSKVRETLSRTANKYVQIALGISIKDSTSGFRIYSAPMLRQMKVESMASEGYCFQIEMTRKALLHGATVAEIPITFIEREFGKSKMSLAIAVEAVLRTTAWGFLRLFGR